MSKICLIFDKEFKSLAQELNIPEAVLNSIYGTLLESLNPNTLNNPILPTKTQFKEAIINNSDITTEINIDSFPAKMFIIKETSNKYYNFNTITFEEEQSTGYRERTIKNASADATIALATDFNSAGEKLTKSSVLNQGKKYIPIDANSLEVTEDRVNKIVDTLNSLKINTPENSISLNIAGNGIYTMKGKYTQQQVDEFTYELLKAVTESPNLKVNISSIRSGGQTGFDEAGIKAAQRLGIPSKILAPKGWKFRDISGVDITDENKFKSRFLNITKELEVKPTISKESLPDEMFKAEKVNKFNITFEKAKTLSEFTVKNHTVKGTKIIIENQPNTNLFIYQDNTNHWVILDNKTKFMFPLRGRLGGVVDKKSEAIEALQNSLEYHITNEKSRTVLESIGFDLTNYPLIKNEQIKSTGKQITSDSLTQEDSELKPLETLETIVAQNKSVKEPISTKGKSEVQLKKEKLHNANIDVNTVSNLISTYIFDLLTDKLDYFRAQNNNNSLTINDLLNTLLLQYPLKDIVTNFLYDNTQKKFKTDLGKAVLENYDLIEKVILNKLKKNYGISITNNKSKYEELNFEIFDDDNQIVEELSEDFGSTNALNLISTLNVSSVKSMSKNLRMMLSKIKDISLDNSNSSNGYRGTKVDMLGNTQKVSMKSAYLTLMEVLSSNQNKGAVTSVGINRSHEVFQALVNNVNTYPWMLSLIDEFAKHSDTAKQISNALNEFLFDNPRNNKGKLYIKDTKNFATNFENFYNRTFVHARKSSSGLKTDYQKVVVELARKTKNKSIASRLFTGFFRNRHVYTAMKDSNIIYLNRLNSASKLRDRVRDNLKFGNVNINSDITNNPNKGYSLFKLGKGETFIKTLENISKETNEVKQIFDIAITDESREAISERVYNVFNMFGINLSLDDFQTLMQLDKVGNQVQNILNTLNRMNVKNDNMELFLRNNYTNYHFIGEQLLPIFKNEIEESFYYNDDSYYSMALNNYVTRMVRKLKSPEYLNEILNLFKQDNFLYNKNTDRFYSRWLHKISNSLAGMTGVDTNPIEVFTQLDYNGVQLKDFSPKMYLNSSIENYFSYKDEFIKNNVENTSVYIGPIIGDSQVHMLYKAPYYKLNSVNDDSETIYYAIAEYVFYEARRIASLQRAIKDTEDAKIELSKGGLTEDRYNTLTTLIDNNERVFRYVSGETDNGFEYKDTVAKTTMLLFNSFPILNNEKYKDTILNILNLQKDNESKIKALIEILSNLDEDGKVNLFNSIMDTTKQELIKDGTITPKTNPQINPSEKNEITYFSALSLLNNKSEEEMNNLLLEYSLNHFYAQSQIHLIFNNDVAQFKSIEDAQKRTKQSSSPGEYGDVTIWQEEMGRTDINYAIVSDKIKASNVLPQIEYIINNNNNLSASEKAEIIEKYRTIETTDGQSFISLKAYVAKLKAHNLWNSELDEVLDKVNKNNFTKTDLDLLDLEPGKPHVFSKIPRTTQALGKDNQFIPVSYLGGIQLKNSEYVILPYTKESDNNPLYNSYETYLAAYMQNNNIDVIAFNSNVKVGLMNNLGYNQFKNIVINNIPFDNSYITKIPFEDVKFQQEITDHYTEDVAALGVQIRKIVMTNLPETINVNGETISKDTFLKVYKELFETIYENGFNNIKKLFETENKFQLIERIREAINTSDKYPEELNTLLDLMENMSDENGNVGKLFLYDPMFTSTFQKILISIIKKEVIKLTLPGGSLVQASLSGSDDLKIIFDTVDDKPTNINHVEAILPWSMKESFSEYVDEFGYVDVEELNKRDPNLLKAIGYRIPSEAHYSLFPLRIVKFSDKASGNTVVLPNDLMVIAGFDFDIDKLFIILPEIKTHNSVKKELFKKEMYYDVYREGALDDIEFVDASKKEHTTYKLPSGKNKQTAISKQDFDKNMDIILSQMDNEMQFTNGTLEDIIQRIYNDNKSRYSSTKISRVEYNKADIKKNNRPALNNLFFDLVYGAITTGEAMNEQIIPGSFDHLKKTSRIFTVKKLSPNESLNLLSKKNIKELNTLTNNAVKSISSIFNITTMRDIHKKNTIAAKSIGVFANQITNIPITQLAKVKLVGKVLLFEDKNTKIGVDTVSAENAVVEGVVKKITRRISGHASASVDAVKDPVFDDLNVNMFTIDVVVFLLRGSYKGQAVSDVQMGAFLNQPVIHYISDIFKNGGKSKTNIIKETIEVLQNEYKKQNDTKSDLEFGNEDVLSMKQLEKHLNGNIDFRDLLTDPNIDIKTQLQVLLKYAQIFQYSSILSSFTNKLKVDTEKGSLHNSILESNDKLESIEDVLQYFNTGGELKKGVHLFEMVDFLSDEGDAKTTIPIVKAALDYGLKKPLELLNVLFPYNTPMYKQALKILKNSINPKSLNSKIKEKYIKSLTSYLLANNTHIKDNYILNGEYERFMNFFPAYVANQVNKGENKEALSNLEIFKYIRIKSPYGSNAPVLALDVKGKLEGEITDRIRDSWRNMLNIDKILAQQLFVYEFLRNGLQFNSNSFGLLAPIEVIDTIPNYYKEMSDLLNTINSISDKDTDAIRRLKVFNIQFIKNNLSTLATPIKNDKDIITFEDDFAKIDSDIAGDIKIFYVTIDNNKVYYLLNTFNTTDNINTYQRIEPYGIGSYMNEYIYDDIDTLEDIAIKESMYKKYNTSTTNIPVEEIPAEIITETTPNEFIMDETIGTFILNPNTDQLVQETTSVIETVTPKETTDDTGLKICK